MQVKLTIIATDLPRVNTEVKHRAEQEGQTSGDIVGGFLIRPLSRTHEFVLNLNLQAQLRNAKQRYEEQVFIVQVIEIADVSSESIVSTFKAKQSIHELYVCLSSAELFIP